MCYMLQARESPDPTFDVSNCELSDIPFGVYSLCKVLRKQVSYLSENISSFIQLCDVEHKEILALKKKYRGNLKENNNNLF